MRRRLYIEVTPQPYACGQFRGMGRVQERGTCGMAYGRAHVDV